MTGYHVFHIVSELIVSLVLLGALWVMVSTFLKLVFQNDKVDFAENDELEEGGA